MGVALIAAAASWALWGCFGPPPNAPDPNTDYAICSKPISGKGGDQEAPTVRGRPLTTEELVARGNEFLEAGLARKAALRWGGEPELDAAANCFGRASVLSHESYEATLGIGIIHLARAQTAVESRSEDDKARELSAAKSMLGGAYMIRRGAYEPLFYLAWVNILEGDTGKAKGILEELKKAEYRPAAVALLEGYIAEQSGDTEGANAAYATVRREGWPTQAVDYAAEHSR